MGVERGCLSGLCVFCCMIDIERFGWVCFGVLWCGCFEFSLWCYTTDSRTVCSWMWWLLLF